MTIKELFINDSGHVRSGWRFAIFLAAFIVSAAFSGGIIMLLLHSFAGETGPASALVLTFNALAALIPALVIGWLCGKYLEDLPFRALGASFTNGWLKHLVLGIAVGGVTLGVAVLFAMAFGGLTFTLNRTAGTFAIISTLGISIIIFTVAAAFEEVFFRGYMLQTFARAGFAWLAIALTSLFFGFVHMNNPDAGIFSMVNTILAGVWFGIAYMKTRDLWFVLGLHMMWNWMQGAFFGIEVSGLKEIIAAPLLREVDRGPAWLTGENYGIEGGIACTLAILLSIAATHLVSFVKASDEMLALTSKRP